MWFPVSSKIILQTFHQIIEISQAVGLHFRLGCTCEINFLGITHKDFKKAVFSKISAGLAQISETSRFRDRNKTETLYETKTSPGLRDPRPAKNGLKTEIETETWSQDYNTGQQTMVCPQLHNVWFTISHSPSGIVQE